MRFYLGSVLAGLALAAALASSAMAGTAARTAPKGAGWYITHGLAETVTNKAFKATNPGIPMSTVCFGEGGSLPPKGPGGARYYSKFWCRTTIYLPTRTPVIKTTLRVRNKYYVSLQQGWGDTGKELGRYRYP